MQKLSAHKAYHWWATRGWFYDPTDDGPEVEIILREQENNFIVWYESLPERWERVWKNAMEFVKRWNPDVR